MRKMILAALLFGVSAITQAGSWHKVYSDRFDNATYVDVSSIERNGNLAYYWVKEEYSDGLMHEIADCRKHTIGITFAKGGGSPGYSYPNPKMDPMTMYGGGKQILAYVCRSGRGIKTATTKPAGMRHISTVEILPPPSKTSMLFTQAVDIGNYQVADMYLQQGADVNCRNCIGSGLTSLMVAIDRDLTSGNTPSQKIRYLIEHGANPNIQDDQGLTALLHAMRKGIDIFYNDTANDLYLFDHGADPRIADKNGDGALAYLAAHSIGATEGANDHWRQYQKQVAVLTNTLLEHGAELNRPNLAGQTPVYIAAANCSAGTAIYFAMKGANLNVKTRMGETPLSIAMEKSTQLYNNNVCMKTLGFLRQPNLVLSQRRPDDYIQSSALAMPASMNSQYRQASPIPANSPLKPVDNALKTFGDILNVLTPPKR